MIEKLRIAYYQFMRTDRTGKQPAGVIINPHTWFKICTEYQDLTSIEVNPYEQKARYRKVPVIRSSDVPEEPFIFYPQPCQ